MTHHRTVRKSEFCIFIAGFPIATEAVEAANLRAGRGFVLETEAGRDGATAATAQAKQEVLLRYFDTKISPVVLLDYNYSDVTFNGITAFAA